MMPIVYGNPGTGRVHSMEQPAYDGRQEAQMPNKRTPSKRAESRSEKRYALYKGGTIVGVGTAEELAALVGVKPSTIRWYATPIAHGRGSMRAEAIA